MDDEIAHELLGRLKTIEERLDGLEKSQSQLQEAYARSRAHLRRFWLRPPMWTFEQHSPRRLDLHSLPGPPPLPSHVPAIAIVTPSFNHAPFLAATIDSILGRVGKAPPDREGFESRHLALAERLRARSELGLSDADFAGIEVPFTERRLGPWEILFNQKDPSRDVVMSAQSFPSAGRPAVASARELGPAGFAADLQATSAREPMREAATSSEARCFIRNPVRRFRPASRAACRPGRES